MIVRICDACGREVPTAFTVDGRIHRPRSRALFDKHVRRAHPSPIARLARVIRPLRRTFSLVLASTVIALWIVFVAATTWPYGVEVFGFAALVSAIFWALARIGIFKPPAESLDGLEGV